jgi:hypothetical protein
VFSLHKQIKKKNDFIESMVNKILDNAQNMNKDDVYNALKNMNQFNMPAYTKDKILDDSILNFVFGDSSDVHIFVHYTKDESIAKLILEEGFRFSNSFYKTAENVYYDKVDFAYRHHLHKKYGSYVLVISINRNVYNKYFDQLKNIATKNILVEQIMTEVPVQKDENFTEIYLLPKYYIKGYFNFETGEIITSKDFNPSYDSVKFSENIKLRS